MEERISNAWICQVTKNSINPIFGDLLYENGKIKEIEKKKFKDYLDGKFETPKNSFDAKGKVVTTSNVNFHEHIYSRLAKGLNITGETDDFENILKNIWWKLDFLLTNEMTKSSAEMAALESIKNGVTYVFDHHSSPNHTKGSLKIIADTLKKFNLKGVLAVETSDRDGKKIAEDCIEENASNIKTIEDKDIKFLFGLHASFTIDDETLAKVSKVIQETNAGIHIHLCEDTADRKISKEVYGQLPLQRLIKFGLLNQNSILSHAIHVTKAEYKKIADLKIPIAMNVDSNMNNGVGVIDFKLLDKDQILLCGTDGMHANPVKTLKNLFLLMRHAKLTNEDVFERISKIYFDQINFVKKFFPEYSLLKKDENADLTIWDYAPPTPINKNNFWGHYLFGVTESAVSSVMMNGNFLMKEKKLISINEEDVQKGIYKSGEKLFNKFKKS